MHDLRLPRRGPDGRELTRQASGRLGGSLAQGIAKGGDLARLQMDRALREPAERVTLRLLTQFNPARSVSRLNKHEQQAFCLRRGGERGEDRFHGEFLAGWLAELHGGLANLAKLRISLNSLHFTNGDALVNHNQRFLAGSKLAPCAGRIAGPVWSRLWAAQSAA
jgi:hypothetical protein